MYEDTGLLNASGRAAGMGPVNQTAHGMDETGCLLVYEDTSLLGAQRDAAQPAQAGYGDETQGFVLYEDNGSSPAPVQPSRCSPHSRIVNESAS